MSCDEKTALLGQQAQIIIAVPTVLGHPKDYEPIFSTADYSHGLTLEELLPYTSDPWWQSVRRLCFGCLWLAFLLTLVAACTLAYLDSGSSCRPIIPTTTMQTRLLLSSSATPSPVLSYAGSNGTLLLTTQ
ncbi:uncharacterized protein LOC115621707 [Scaptodrosophila lebanonensis]|uniref:Uncharacterized protein LOC115621707 n=1 Tax=Drosophila lebanonensis TaxID=7225 RepID=A0A6J2T5G6_DROLE|nr:uncharacterized protein LOC115621707 [Scaptodrosophila lebanonensis]